MKTIKLLQFGIGNIGSAVLQQILEQQETLRENHNISLQYCGIVDVDGYCFDPTGIPTEILQNFADRKGPFLSCKGVQPDKNFAERLLEKAYQEVGDSLLIVDVTAAESMGSILEKAREKHIPLVLANKKPLSGTYQRFANLRSGALRHETTVGAGLPVIGTLDNLLITGDEIQSIQGCFSGTLGYLCSEIEEGRKFSSVVRSAKKLGYTEPDPRDDLGGIDVARKALILARMMGCTWELSDIPISPLFPATLAEGSVDTFLDAIEDLDATYAQQSEEAKSRGNTLRFVATITKSSCTVGLQEVALTSDIGSLRGPDNIVVFTTKRYANNPLIVKGPGAGLAVTAGGVFADILSLAH